MKYISEFTFSFKLLCPNKFMKNLAKIIFPIALGILPIKIAAQEFQNCDYIREIKVNHEISSEKATKEQNILFYNDFKEPIGDEMKNSLEDGVMNIYFHHDDSNLTENDLTDLNRYVSKVLVPYGKQKNIRYINVEGYANFIGDEKYNYILSIKRAENVAKILRKKLYCYFPHNIEIRVSAFGENKSSETTDQLQLQKDRRVRISVEENPLEGGLRCLEGRIFLIDQSGSMKDGSWNSLKKYNFPKGKKFYSFSKPVIIEGNPQNYIEFDYKYDINFDTPAGKTAFYGATEKLILSDIVSENDTLAIILNGADNVGISSPSEIIKKAKEKSIVLNILGINIDDSYAKTLMDITTETKGNYYFIEKPIFSKIF